MHTSARVLTAVVVTAAFSFGGCGSDEGKSDSTGSGTPTCVPNESKACAGPEGCSGFQVCAADGASFSDCDCGGGGSGGSSAGAGGAGGGAGSPGTGGSSAGTGAQGGTSAGTGAQGGTSAGTGAQGGSSAGVGAQGGSAGVAGTGGGPAGSSVDCNGTPCDVASGGFCCLSLFGGGTGGFGGFGGFGGTGGGGGSSDACRSPNDPPCSGFGSVPATCDGPGDCSGGQVCCGTLSQGGPGGGIYTDVSCADASSCGGQDHREICDPQASDPCPNGGQCQQSQLLPQGWNVCN